MTAPDQQVIADALATEQVIAEFETSSDQLRDRLGNLTGWHITADNWRAMRAHIRALAASNAGTDPADGQAVAVGLSEDEQEAARRWFAGDQSAWPIVAASIEQLVAEQSAGRRGQDTERALADTWDEGFEAAVEWIERTGRPADIGPPDPPLNPYELRAAGGTP